LLSIATHTLQINSPPFGGGVAAWPLCVAGRGGATATELSKLHIPHKTTVSLSRVEGLLRIATQLKRSARCSGCSEGHLEQPIKTLFCYQHPLTPHHPCVAPLYVSRSYHQKFGTRKTLWSIRQSQHLFRISAGILYKVDTRS
jgi:hypothetical protein